jgi:thiamine kinase-like enzyme
MEKKLTKIINEFQIPFKNYEFETISNGFINDTFLVSFNGTPLYILQRINTKVFPNIHSLIDNLDLVLPVLKDRDYQEVTLVRTNSGKSFMQNSEDEVWRLMTFVKNSIVYNTTKNSEIAFEAGRIIGLFHQLTEKIKVEELKETLEHFHNVAFRYDQFKEALSNADKRKIELAKESIEFVKNNIATLLEISTDNLPVRTCHNDTKLNNILFSRSNKALCLIDLDTIMKGSFLFDFGDAVRTIVNSAKEDEKDLSKINFSMELFETFINGLAIYGKILNKKEKELLPLGVVLMPFLHGIRALTDFLENNKYYKVSYETQNLDRCLSLFTFAQLALNNQSDMGKIITVKMNY